eukprot:1056990-Pelagomonas_calceolata.AAC.1
MPQPFYFAPPLAAPNNLSHFREGLTRINYRREMYSSRAPKKIKYFMQPRTNHAPLQQIFYKTARQPRRGYCPDWVYFSHAVPLPGHSFVLSHGCLGTLMLLSTAAAVVVSSSPDTTTAAAAAAAFGNCWHCMRWPGMTSFSPKDTAPLIWVSWGRLSKESAFPGEREARRYRAGCSRLPFLQAVSKTFSSTTTHHRAPSK